jgi:hypothetical protein
LKEDIMSFSNPEVFSHIYTPPYALVVKNSAGKKVMSFTAFGDISKMSWASMLGQKKFREFIQDADLGVLQTPVTTMPGFLQAKYDSLAVSWRGLEEAKPLTSELGLQFQGVLDIRALMLANNLLSHTVAPYVASEQEEFFFNGIYQRFLENNPNVVPDALPG